MRSFIQFFVIAIAAMSALTLPSARNGVRETVQTLFVPVAAPTRAIGGWLTNRLSPTREPDIMSPGKLRNVDDVLRQNALLVTRLGMLEAQLEDLKQLSAQYSKLDTNLRKLVQPATVTGGPIGNRQTLTIATTSLATVKEHMVVVHPTGLVGQIYAIATGGGTARVLLITDPESRIGARFVRYQTAEDGSVTRTPIPTPPPLVEGAGKGLVVRQMAADDVRNKVQPGDAVELADPNWPTVTQGLRLGVVRRIVMPSTGVGHAVIELDPTADFGKLREVLVLDK